MVENSTIKVEKKEMKDEEFFHQKPDLKIILLGDTAVGKSKYVNYSFFYILLYY